MLLDFDRIRHKVVRRVNNLGWRVAGFFYGLAYIVSGRLRQLHTDLQKISKEIQDGIRGISHEEPIYVVVGRAITHWATMEETLVFIFAFLLRIETAKAGLILYSIINFNVWLSLVDDELFAVDDTYRNLKPKWNKLAVRLKALKDQRDRIAHHSVQKEAYAETISDVFIRPSEMDIRRKSLSHEPMDYDDIMQFSSKVISITSELIDLVMEMQKLLGARPSSPEKSVE